RARAPGRVARRAARLGLPLDGGGRAARHPPPHPALPHGAAAAADGPSPRRPGAADGALARRARPAGAARARGGDGVSRDGPPAQPVRQTVPRPRIASATMRAMGLTVLIVD